MPRVLPEPGAEFPGCRSGSWAEILGLGFAEFGGCIDLHSRYNYLLLVG
jgi:hypothetical protein